MTGDISANRSLGDFFRRRLWEGEAEGLQGLPLRGLRLLVLAGRGLLRNRGWLQAAILAYATMLALIPLLALLFAILKSLGLQRLLASHLMDRLAPGSQEFAAQILEYIEQTQVTSLGVFGVVFLLAALVILMSNVERALNCTWQVSRTRPWLRKFSDYLSIFLIFPILMAVAISLSSGILSQPDIRHFLSTFMPEFFFSATTSLFSLGLLWVAFTFIYLVMPNTRVTFRAALLGGVVGGSLWQLAHYIFAWFQGMATYYNAIYGALYHLLFLVVWMFYSWLVVLYGTEIAYASQNMGRLLRQVRRPGASGEAVDEHLALAVLALAADRFLKRRTPLSVDELEEMVGGQDHLATRVAEVLQACRLLVVVPPAAPGDAACFLPALPPDQVTVGEALHHLRQSRGEALAARAAGAPALEAVVQRLMAAAPPSPLDSLSLKELVARLEAEGPVQA
ncbi:MAG: YihY/virulence factor BrkB family protein [Deltaproteobacteria bacterium]|nr:YihY/virulence factor BrkB family protein [Deltaproteobacteria bacterium]